MRDDFTFREAILSDQSPALARAFSDASGGIFASSKSGKARLDVYAAPLINGLWVDDRKQPSQTQSKPPPDAVHSRLHQAASWLNTESITSVEELQHYISSVKGFQAYLIGQRNSYSALLTSSGLFSVLCRERQVSPQFRDYILYFGERESEIEIAPPALRFRSSTPSNSQDGTGQECLCGIRYVDRNSRTDVEEPSSRWSLRQCAIYYHRATSSHEQTWVFATISESCRYRLAAYFSQQPTLQNVNVFEVLLLLIDTVMGHWRPYVVALNVETEAHATQLLGASPDNRGPIGMADSGQRQTLMLLDDKMGNTIQVLKSTKDDLAILARRKTESSGASSNDTILLAIDEKINELDRLILKVEALRARLAGIANLVSSFLDLSNGFALQQLGKESRRENEQMRSLSERMHVLAERNTQDAAAIKVLTILTLVYLPLTVVTNFFSTSFIGTAGHRIFVTDDWWILLASALPLTIITLYVWWVWMRIKAYKIWPWWWLRRLRPPLNNSNSIEKASKPADSSFVSYEAEPRIIQRVNTDWYDSNVTSG